MVYDGIIISFIVGLLRKGNLKGLAELKLKYGWIFPLLLLVQIIVFVFQNKIPFLGQASPYIYMLVYVLGLLFLFLNRHHTGFIAIFIGVFLNFLVMAVNGGRMPVSMEATAAVLDPAFVDVMKNSLYAKHMILDESTRLAFLGDIIPLTNPYPRDQVISIGDVIMNVGIFLFIQHLMVNNSRDEEVIDSSFSIKGGEIK
ncbi:hypothetical protein AM500_02605 [Bacillus sp. FJAT-18017]|uniref:DUF5317 domain-containing protein n=1 Tax=Bacillus sp. FJAT-18017 TaxID=1705566 RepID=UPI0006ADBD76|nr:DUF5317 domain-containing protein [Bacillus sp. FJAT-18017]ALC88812.1 hypothetical protein AM500_02605 [Bacillus sp. FJAT-18017]